MLYEGDVAMESNSRFSLYDLRTFVIVRGIEQQTGSGPKAPQIINAQRSLLASHTFRTFRKPFYFTRQTTTEERDSVDNYTISRRGAISV